MIERLVAPWVRPLLAHLAVAIMIATMGLSGGAYAFVHMDRIEDGAGVWLLAHRGRTNGTGHPTAVTLPGGSQVVLERGSRMWSPPVPDSAQPVIQLEGTGIIDVTDPGSAAIVATSVGEALLTPGRFRVVAEDSTGMRVIVERGSARVRGRILAGKATDWITLGPGQETHVPAPNGSSHENP